MQFLPYTSYPTVSCGFASSKWKNQANFALKFFLESDLLNHLVIGLRGLGSFQDPDQVWEEAVMGVHLKDSQALLSDIPRWMVGSIWCLLGLFMDLWLSFAFDGWGSLILFTKLHIFLLYWELLDGHCLSTRDSKDCFFLTECEGVVRLIYQWMTTLIILGNVPSKTSGGRAGLTLL